MSTVFIVTTEHIEATDYHGRVEVVSTRLEAAFTDRDEADDYVRESEAFWRTLPNFHQANVEPLTLNQPWDRNEKEQSQ